MQEFKLVIDNSSLFGEERRKCDQGTSDDWNCTDAKKELKQFFDPDTQSFFEFGYHQQIENIFECIFKAGTVFCGQ